MIINVDIIIVTNCYAYIFVLLFLHFFRVGQSASIKFDNFVDFKSAHCTPYGN